MEILIVASMREDAGKTSVTVGLVKALNKKLGYIKPLGDRLLYRKKRLWDYDSALVSDIFNLSEDPGDMSIGFDHAKLKFMYDEAGMKARVLEDVSDVSPGKDLVIIECGKSLTSGTSVHLDPLSVAKYTGGKLIIIVSGDDEAVVDDVTFLQKYVDFSEINFGGVIINKLQDVENFESVFSSEIDSLGINILGMIPHKTELTQFTISYLAERLFAKVVAGEAGLNRVINNILVGATSVNEALRNPSVKTTNALTITNGDRTDVILAALDSDANGIVLSNNILPPSNIISQASKRGVPLLLVQRDTYETARQIYNLQPLLTRSDTDKIALLEQLVQEHVQLEALL